MSKLRLLLLGSPGSLHDALHAALLRSDWATVRTAGVGADARTVDASSGAALARAFPEIDLIVNATSGVPQRIEDNAKLLSQSQSLALAGSERPRIVHLGSMTVYGAVEGRIGEDAPLNPELGAYAASQIEAEKLALATGNTTVLRLGCEYGAGCEEWSARIARFLQARRLGDLGAAGDGYCNLTFIDDIAQAISRVAQNTSSGAQVFNLCAPSPPTWNEYLLMFARALGYVPIRRVTQRRLRLETRLLALPLKIIERVTQKAGVARNVFSPAMTPSLLRLCGQEIRLDCSRATETLGMRWTDPVIGVKAAADWYLARENR